mmetsp:Transcript_7702/g.22496  ORF Transcript_7702/g.22496 Transcript_7702/m.22496 type:complete len:217 (+) Transcript_7702:447-1097(+)
MQRTKTRSCARPWRARRPRRARASKLRLPQPSSGTRLLRCLPRPRLSRRRNPWRLSPTWTACRGHSASTMATAMVLSTRLSSRTCSKVWATTLTTPSSPSSCAATTWTATGRSPSTSFGKCTPLCLEGWSAPGTKATCLPCRVDLVSPARQDRSRCRHCDGRRKRSRRSPATFRHCALLGQQDSRKAEPLHAVRGGQALRPLHDTDAAGGARHDGI